MTVEEFAALCDEQPETDEREGFDEPPCGDPRPDPRTHPEYWTE